VDFGKSGHGSKAVLLHGKQWQMLFEPRISKIKDISFRTFQKITLLLGSRGHNKLRPPVPFFLFSKFGVASLFRAHVMLGRIKSVKDSLMAKSQLRSWNTACHGFTVFEPFNI
jgi:hypothetical protein